MRACGRACVRVVSVVLSSPQECSTKRQKGPWSVLCLLRLRVLIFHHVHNRKLFWMFIALTASAACRTSKNCILVCCYIISVHATAWFLRSAQVGPRTIQTLQSFLKSQVVYIYLRAKMWTFESTVLTQLLRTCAHTLAEVNGCRCRWSRKNSGADGPESNRQSIAKVPQSGTRHQVRQRYHRFVCEPVPPPKKINK